MEILYFGLGILCCGTLFAMLREKKHTKKNRPPKTQQQEYSFAYMHSFSRNHRPQAQQAKMCGCFFCGSLFPPKEIKEWTDPPWDAIKKRWNNMTEDQRRAWVNQYGQTALCPCCGTDAVLPDNGGFLVNKETLDALYQEYYY